MSRSCLGAKKKQNRMNMLGNDSILLIQHFTGSICCEQVGCHTDLGTVVFGTSTRHAKWTGWFLQVVQSRLRIFPFAARNSQGDVSHGQEEPVKKDMITP